MSIAAALCVAGSAVILAAGAWVAAAPRFWDRAVRCCLDRPAVDRTLRRLRLARDGLVEALGHTGAFVVVVLACVPPMIVVCWLLGWLGQHPPLADALGPPSASLFDWFQDQQARAPPWLTGLFQAVTKVAEWELTFLISGAAAVTLALASRQRRWLPPLLIGSAVAAERYIQKVIASMVAEPPPPTSLGNYPSGGVARVLAVYGLIGWLFLRLRPDRGRQVRVVWWTGVALLSFLVGHARGFLLLHWPIDIPGGVLFGLLLLAVLLSAATAFERPVRHEPERQPG